MLTHGLFQQPACMRALGRIPVQHPHALQPYPEGGLTPPRIPSPENPLPGGRHRTTRASHPTGSRPARHHHDRSRRPQMENQGPLTQSDLDQLVASFNQGATTPELAERYGVSPTSIKTILGHHGTRRRPKQGPYPE